MAGNKAQLAARIEESLKQAALWDEVKDRLQSRRSRCRAGSSSTPMHRARAGGAP